MKTILLVEDDLTSLELYNEFLNVHDYYVISCTDGLDALEKTLTKFPDLLIIDLFLPGINGDELVREIKKNPSVEKIPIIILSGIYSLSDAIKKCPQVESSCVLQKPAKFTYLIKLIKEKLNQNPENGR